MKINFSIIFLIIFSIFIPTSVFSQTNTDSNNLAQNFSNELSYQDILNLEQLKGEELSSHFIKECYQLLNISDEEKEFEVNTKKYEDLHFCFNEKLNTIEIDKTTSEVLISMSILQKDVNTIRTLSINSTQTLEDAKQTLEEIKFESSNALNMSLAFTVSVGIIGLVAAWYFHRLQKEHDKEIRKKQLQYKTKRFEEVKTAMLTRLNHFTDSYKNLTDHVGTPDEFTEKEKEILAQFFEKIIILISRNYEYLSLKDAEHIEVQCNQCLNYLSKKPRPTQITPKSPHELKTTTYQLQDYIEKMSFHEEKPSMI